MEELKTCYNLFQVPYITDEALDSYAESIVAAFSPERLRDPGPFDIEGFLEYYLGLDVQFRRLSYGRKVLGLTAFDDGCIYVRDENTGEKVPMPVKAGTVVIDTSLSSKRNEPRLRFTCGHEGSHWLIHRKAFAPDNPWKNVGELNNPSLAAKLGRIDYSRSRIEKTDRQRVERQADFLSSAVLMNRPALRIVFKEFLASFGEPPRRIIRSSGQLDDVIARELPGYVANVFNVSKRAALIRLEKLHAIVDRDGLWMFGL